MRVKRSSLTSGNKSRVFHVVSRVVGRQLIFGDQEKSFFHSCLRKMESYSGLEVLSYCLMGNHFHLLLHVPPKPEEISIRDVRKRMVHKYSRRKIAEFEAFISQMKEKGSENFEVEFYEKQWVRMFDLSNFLKEIKEQFSKWYNKKEQRSGTLWESRYSSSLVEGRPDTLMGVGAYIELNPIRAGIVDRIEKYRWCSFSEAVAGGGKAREGIAKMVNGLKNGLSAESAITLYKQKLYSPHYCEIEKNNESIGRHSEAIKKYDEVDISKSKVRFYTDGLAIGSKEFLDEFMNSYKDIVPENRKSPITEIKGTNIFSYRNVR